MLGFQEKRKFRRVLSSRITIAVLLVLIFFVARGTWSVYWKERDSAGSLESAEKTYAELEARQESVSGKIADLKTPRGVEEEIRSRYEVARPGEEVALVIDDAPTSTPAAPENPVWWKELFSWIGIGK